MEVHHHAHTARKKWTHYLFRMLRFLLYVAVGFLCAFLYRQLEINTTESL